MSTPSVVRRPYLLSSLPSDGYRALLDLGATICDTAAVIIKPWTLTHSGQRVLERLRHDLRREGPVTAWPLTQQGADESPRRAQTYALTFSLTPAVCALLQEALRLEDWQQPNRPEDLALLHDGAPWLASVAHEGIALVHLSDEERRQLPAAVLGALVDPDTVDGRELAQRMSTFAAETAREMQEQLSRAAALRTETRPPSRRTP